MQSKQTNKVYKNPRTKSYKNSYSNKKVDTVQDKQIKTLVKKVAKLEVEPELKYIHNYLTANVGTSPGDAYFALNIAQGDDYNQRVGEEIMLKKQDWILNLIMPASLSAIRYRVILFMDNQTNGNPPALLASVSSTAGLLDDLTITDTQYSPYNPRCSERYKIYNDKSYIYNRSEPTISERHSIKLSKIFNTRIKYSNSSGVLSSLASKSVHLAVFVASVGTVGTYDVIATTYFTDQ